MPTVLVTGATGYIGGRLVPELLDAGYDVRCLVRTPTKLRGIEWMDRVEVVQGSLEDDAAVREAMDGCTAAYFLVHSMGGSDDFAATDRRNARLFAEAAADTPTMERIVYLGGLGRESEDLSTHLRSRHEVGDTLRVGRVPVTELRAAVIIGSGSASFEMLRNLVEVLPAMVTPRWVDTKVQPIAIRDILHALVTVLERPDALDRVIEVGGPDVLTYREMMHTYADVAGLRKRWIVPVPVLSPSLSSRWVGLVTPLPGGLARPLVESLVNEVIVHDHSIDLFADRPAVSFRESLQLALRRVEDVDVRHPLVRRVAARARPRPIRCPPTPTGPAARSSSTSRAAAEAPRPTPSSPSPPASVASGAGSSPTSCGASAASPTSSSADRGCGAAGATPTTSGSATRSTSGGSRPTSRPACSGCGPRCACPARRGWSGSWRTTVRAGRCCASGRCSCPVGSSDGCTGTPSCRSTP